MSDMTHDLQAATVTGLSLTMQDISSCSAFSVSLSLFLSAFHPPVASFILSNLGKEIFLWFCPSVRSAAAHSPAYLAEPSFQHGIGTTC